MGHNVRFTSDVEFECILIRVLIPHSSRRLLLQCQRQTLRTGVMESHFNTSKATIGDGAKIARYRPGKEVTEQIVQLYSAFGLWGCACA